MLEGTGSSVLCWVLLATVLVPTQYVKELGANQVFDYNSKTVVDDLINAFKGETIASTLAIANGVGDGKAVADARDTGNYAAEASLAVVDKSEGVKFVSMTLPVPDKLPSGVGAKFIFASDLKDSDVSKPIFENFLPKALAEGKYVAAPNPQVCGEGSRVHPRRV